MGGAAAFATSSYPSDEGLLAELRGAWPPTDRDDGAAPTSGRGYAKTDLGDTVPSAAIRLGGRFAVALIGAGDGSFHVVPLARNETLITSWQLARAGDGLSAFVAGVPMASERAINTDQTNASVIVGERAIVKWFRRAGPGPSRAATLSAHLDSVGFSAIPPPLGSLVWRSPRDIDLVIAQGDGYLAGARDGWEWAVARLERHVEHGGGECPATCEPWIGAPLGRLVVQLHAALATPSAVIATPRMQAPPEAVASWHERARSTLTEAIDLTDADEPGAGATLRALEPGLRSSIDRLRSARSAATQPVHGDLHVGQVLEWAGGLAVIDFDGNPALDPAANALRQPVERDLAQMLSSLDHVGRIVANRVEPAAEGADERTDAIERWIARARREFLGAAGGTPDPALLGAFEVEQECRELVYAARFLPRWRYAPMATLRDRFVS